MSFLTKMCTPALIYFSISTLMVLIIFFQNISNTNTYCISKLQFNCDTPTFIFIFAIKMLAILFWSYVLNLICKNGHTGLSWFLLFLPLIIILLVFSIVYTKLAIN